MVITKRSILSGITRTQDFPITQEQYDEWQAGAFVQDAFPHLTPCQREFLINGTTPEEWEQYGLNDEEEE